MNWKKEIGACPLLILLVATDATALAAPVTPVPEKISCAVADRQGSQIPDWVHLAGWLGSRIGANESNRLVQLDPARHLEGYRKRPGRQSWDGEHVGKRLHAARLVWAFTGDPACGYNPKPNFASGAEMQAFAP